MRENEIKNSIKKLIEILDRHSLLEIGHIIRVLEAWLIKNMNIEFEQKKEE